MDASGRLGHGLSRPSRLLSLKGCPYRLVMFLTFLTLKKILPDTWDCLVLIRLDNMSVISYLNHLPIKVQNNFLSVKVVHVPDRLNLGADLGHVSKAFIPKARIFLFSMGVLQI